MPSRQSDAWRERAVPRQEASLLFLLILSETKDGRAEVRRNHHPDCNHVAQNQISYAAAFGFRACSRKGRKNGKGNPYRRSYVEASFCQIAHMNPQWRRREAGPSFQLYAVYLARNRMPSPTRIATAAWDKQARTMAGWLGVKSRANPCWASASSYQWCSAQRWRAMRLLRASCSSGRRLVGMALTAWPKSPV